MQLQRHCRKAWPRMFYEHTLYSLRPPPETGVLLMMQLSYQDLASTSLPLYLKKEEAKVSFCRCTTI